MCTFSIVSTITNKGAGCGGREHTYIKLYIRCIHNRKKRSIKKVCILQQELARELVTQLL